MPAEAVLPGVSEALRILAAASSSLAPAFEMYLINVGLSVMPGEEEIKKMAGGNSGNN